MAPVKNGSFANSPIFTTRVQNSTSTNGELSSYLKLLEGRWSRIDQKKTAPSPVPNRNPDPQWPSTRHLSICAALLPILHHAPGGKHEGAILQWMDGLTSSKPRHPLCPPKTNVNMFLENGKSPQFSIGNTATQKPHSPVGAGPNP